MHLRKILYHFLTEEQVVQGTERTVLFHLVDGHFVSVYRQFNKATPAVKLMGTNLPNILGVAIWTFHHPFITYPSTEFMVFQAALRCWRGP